jgi:parallel beta-helix repeat protein
MYYGKALPSVLLMLLMTCIVTVVIMGQVPIGVNACGSQRSAGSAGLWFESIQAAINAAEEGDTIQVPSGVYNEQLVINKSVALVGLYQESTIISSSGMGTLVQIEADGVQLSNFTIRSSGQGSVGIALSNHHDASIISNMIIGHAQGLSVENSNNNTVKANVFTSNDLSIVISQSNNNSLSENLFFENFSPSISMYGCRSNMLDGNVIRNNPAYGVYLESCIDCILRCNNVSYVCEGIYLQACRNVRLTGNIVMQTGPNAIHLQDSSNNIVEDNVLSLNEFSLQLWGSTENLLRNNSIFNNKHGLRLWFSGNNTLEKNNMTGNWWSFAAFGSNLQNFVNNVSTSNTVNGRPVYYLVNCNNATVPSDAGYVAVVNSTGIEARDLQLTENHDGLLVAFSSFTLIQNVTFIDNWNGVTLVGCANNTITRCTFEDNLFQVLADASDGNLIYNNNFFGETCRVYSRNSASIWDNGYPEGGNFWEPHTISDSYHGAGQDQVGSDALVDTPYVVNPDNTDRYPLAGQITFFEAGTWNSKPYYFNIVGNATITHVSFNSSEGPFIRIDVSVQNGHVGFCRPAIPKDVIWVDSEEWQVRINNKPAAFLAYDDDCTSFVYLTFDWSAESILIQGSAVVSEQLSLTILLGTMFACTSSAIFLRKLSRRRNKA